MKFKSSTTKALRRVKENLKGELHQGTESMLWPLILRKHSDHPGRALQKKRDNKNARMRLGQRENCHPPMITKS